MQYYQAVQAGKQRAGKSQMKLFEVAGFAMLTLTTKKIDGEFKPVDEQDYAAIIQNQNGFITLIADKDGFTKAQTKAVDKDEALKIFKKLREGGMEEFPGKTIEIWTESFPTIQKTLE